MCKIEECNTTVGLVVFLGVKNAGNEPSIMKRFKAVAHEVAGRRGRFVSKSVMNKTEFD